MLDKHSTAREKADAVITAAAVIAEEQELADALVEIAEKYGKFNEDDTGIWAGYESAAENERADIGVTCANCILYAGGTTCKILAAEVEPGGYCRFALIPDGIVSAKVEEKESATAVSLSAAASRRAPKKDRIYGSKKNKPGSASGGKKIVFSAKTETALKNKVKQHNEKASPNRRATLSMLKAVYRRGAGAYSSSHRPGKTRDQWAMARVNAYLKLLKSGKPSNPNYKQDNDLLPKTHPRSSKSRTASAMTASAIAESELTIELMEADEYQSPEHALVAFAEYSGLGYEVIPALRAAWLRAVAAEQNPFDRARALAELTYESEDKDLLPNPKALTAGFLTGAKGKAWRSAKAKLQRRDRRGRFAEMGGGFSFSFSMSDGSVRRATGKVVGMSGEEDVDVEVADHPNLPNGVYSVPASKGEAAKAVLSKEALKGVDWSKVKDAEVDDAIPVADLKRATDDDAAADRIAGSKPSKAKKKEDKAKKKEEKDAEKAEKQARDKRDSEALREMLRNPEEASRRWHEEQALLAEMFETLREARDRAEGRLPWERPWDPANSQGVITPGNRPWQWGETGFPRGPLGPDSTFDPSTYVFPDLTLPEVDPGFNPSGQRLTPELRRIIEEAAKAAEADQQAIPRRPRGEAPDPLRDRKLLEDMVEEWSRMEEERRRNPFWRDDMGPIRSGDSGGGGGGGNNPPPAPPASPPDEPSRGGMSPDDAFEKLKEKYGDELGSLTAREMEIVSNIGSPEDLFFIANKIGVSEQEVADMFADFYDLRRGVDPEQRARENAERAAERAKADAAALEEKAKARRLESQAYFEETFKEFQDEQRELSQASEISSSQEKKFDSLFESSPEFKSFAQGMMRQGLEKEEVLKAWQKSKVDVDAITKRPFTLRNEISKRYGPADQLTGPDFSNMRLLYAIADLDNRDKKAAIDAALDADVTGGLTEVLQKATQSGMEDDY